MTRLYFRRAPANGSLKGKVLLFHGYNDHSGRYTELIEDFAKAGFEVLAPDLRGHGQSQGDRGHIDGFDDYLEDASDAFNALSPDGAPVHVFGHSMGGLVAIHFAAKHPGKVKTLTLCAPYLGRAMKTNPLKIAAGHVLGRITPKIALPTGLTGAHCTHDPVRATLYDNDPYNFGKATAGWFVNVEKAMTEAVQLAVRLQMPLYWLHGEMDEVASPAVSKIAFDKAESRDKLWVPWPGMRHEPLNELERDRVRQGVMGWLSAKT